MVRKWVILLMLLVVTWGCADMGTRSAREEAPRITKEDLKNQLGSPDLVVLDVRTDKDWSSVDTKIAGAVREDPKDFSMWVGKYPKDKTLVLYCT